MIQRPFSFLVFSERTEPRLSRHTFLRRIYTTFILGTALENFGTRDDSFGHGLLDLHGKICSGFFDVDF